METVKHRIAIAHKPLIKAVGGAVWIPVKNKLPKVGRLVIMANNEKGERWICAGQLQKIPNREVTRWYNQFESYEGNDCECYPTHWMPFPKAPKV